MNCFGCNFAAKVRLICYRAKTINEKGQPVTHNFKFTENGDHNNRRNCGACEPECPNTAIYEGADDWRYKDGTSLRGKVVLPNGEEVDAEAPQIPISDDIYYIVPSKCTECKGFHDEPQCAAVCPVDCCVPDDEYIESDETLLNKQAFLHND